uniref:JmjC domain-containing protein n=1 Tax=Chromera velia CCMP2878 TaxID=1169474 RepID=A0A0K6S7S3_9ALVE|eukprot:Cvel_21180.t1-p1 / transcript=Cvel_21180.t1 / gene=Cvel_21180 / organism=Chromera_velia_CCMP2878 / gene_product=JmjC domain-containing protein 7, putative / transcript_product=JmjC domain-containing protein 7, putative / location=Cvel_scaffold1966:3226-7059(+) / protein_length=543 / sequence_SO=supercontig / SO=protein_coding / is_pseudo=false
MTVERDSDNLSGGREEELCGGSSCRKCGYVKLGIEAGFGVYGEEARGDGKGAQDGDGNFCRDRGCGKGSHKRLVGLLEMLSEEVGDFVSVGEVPSIHFSQMEADPDMFYRQFVAHGRPVKILGLPLCAELKEKWTPEYLVERAGHCKVTVNVTPTGWGDAAHTVRLAPRERGVGWEAEEAQVREFFIKPEERQMNFGHFLENLLKEEEEEGEGSPEDGKRETGRTTQKKFQEPNGKATHEDTGDRQRRREREAGEVQYYSLQNDCLRTELGPLAEELPEALGFGLDAFGNLPEAVNLWVGGRRAISSCHKDHYENLYAVVRGEKHFVLFPPADGGFLGERSLPPASFLRCAQREGHTRGITRKNKEGGDVESDSGVQAIPNGSSTSSSLSVCKGCSEGSPFFSVPSSRPSPPPCRERATPGKYADAPQPDGRAGGEEGYVPLPLFHVMSEEDAEPVPWIAGDVARGPEHLRRHPLFRLAHPVHTVVRAGEVLFLPALWYHRVAQWGLTVAVNFWHDMQFDERWILHNIAKKLAKEAEKGGFSS